MFNMWDGTLKTYRENVACRAGSTQAYVVVKGEKQSVQSVVKIELPKAKFRTIFQNF